MRLPALAAVAVLAGALLAPTLPAAEPWGYTIGQLRDQQQANLCRTREDALEIVYIFRKYGPRPGYAALSNAPGCATEVRGITPTALIDEVVVSPGKPGEYRLRFVEVALSSGETRVLVTTREVAGPRE